MDQSIRKRKTADDFDRADEQAKKEAEKKTQDNKGEKK